MNNVKVLFTQETVWTRVPLLGQTGIVALLETLMARSYQNLRLAVGAVLFVEQRRPLWPDAFYGRLVRNTEFQETGKQVTKLELHEKSLLTSVLT